MSEASWAIIGLSVFGTATMIGIFVTKTKGFGKYSTSVVILSMVVFVSSLFLLIGQISSQVFSNIIFAVAGYAGGLVNGKGDSA